jgi:hypothetical protein
MPAVVRGPVRADEAEAHGGAKVVNGVAVGQLYVVNFNDGKRHNETRLVLRFSAGGGDHMYLFPKGMDVAMQVPADWLKQQIREHLDGTAEEREGGLQLSPETLDAMSVRRSRPVNVLPSRKRGRA